VNSTRGPELKWKRGQRRRKSAPKEEKEARLGRSLARCSRLARCFSREDEEKSLWVSLYETNGIPFLSADRSFSLFGPTHRLTIRA
jgi:hypothetical protein